MFYSAQTGGFYSVEINGENIPEDAVEITVEQHAALLAGQSAGQRIIADQYGSPVLADYPAPSNEKLAARARADRNSRLSACDWTMLTDAPLTLPQREAWAAYRQDLRDVPDQESFPAVIVWPSEPA
jgi:hypothetical protein